MVHKYFNIDNKFFITFTDNTFIVQKADPITQKISICNYIFDFHLNSDNLYQIARFGLYSRSEIKAIAKYLHRKNKKMLELITENEYRQYKILKKKFENKK